MVCLITGAAGMMGSHLYEALKEKSKKKNFYDVVATYHNSTLDERESITKDMEVLDVLDYDSVFGMIRDYRPDYIYHLAAQSRPDVSFIDPQGTFATNVIGTTNLLQACAELGNECTFINASSSAVYGDIDWSIPPDEDSPCNPLSPYGTSKLAQENIVKNYHKMYGSDEYRPLNYVNVRIFNCTGPRKVNDFVSDICRRVVNKEFPLKVGNLDTERSIVDVRDLVRGLIECQTQILYSKNQTINLGSDVSYKMGNLLKLIAGDIPYEVDESLFRPTDEPTIIGNIDKAESLMWWRPEIPITKTISDTLDYWRNL